MNQHSSTLNHRDYEELLAPAALGALTREDHVALTAHLRTCSSCRASLGRLLSTTDTIALTVVERAPSDALRDRLWAQVATAEPPESAPLPPLTTATDAEAPIPLRAEPPAVSTRAHTHERGRALWILAVAATLLLGLVGGVAVDRLLLDGDGQDEVREIAMESPAGLSLDDARLEYFEDPGIIRFSAGDIPNPPEGQVYQVWLIAGNDAPPTPIGVIDPATGEFATTADLDRFGIFAVTVEPGPLGSAAPTTDPVIVAELPEPETG